MASPSRDQREKRIASLVEMGVSRAAAKAALRANAWRTDEAALVVFDDRYADAADIPTSDDEDDNNGSKAATTASPADKGKGKLREVTKLPTPDEDAGSEDDMLNDEDAEDDYEDGCDFFDEDDDDVGGDFAGSDAGSVTYGDGDAYGFIDDSKDREVEITEVEEPVKRVTVSKTRRGEFTPDPSNKDLMEAEIFGLQRWLSGCPEGSEQQQLFPLYTSLVKDDFMPPKCPYKCGGTIEHSETDFFAVPENFTDYIDRLSRICHIACPSCKRGVCLACNEPCDLKPAKVAKQDYKAAPEALLHCSNMQAVIVGVGLHMAGRIWEDVVSIEGQKDKSQTKKRKAADNEAAGSSGDEYGFGAGRSTSFRPGTGYGGGRDDNSGVQAAAKAQKEKDKQLAALLSYVRVYLPNRDRPGPFMNSDHMPASQTLAHLRRRFNPIASLLLSAESLSDMSERKELYTEFMAWLEVMSSHENLAGLMGQQIMRVSSVTYSDAAASSKSGGREKLIVFKASPGPRQLLERILSQVVVAKKVALAAKAREEALNKEREALISEAEKQLIREAEKHAINDSTNQALAQEISGGVGTEETTRLMEFCDTIEKAVSSIDKALKQSKRGEAVLKSMKSTSAMKKDPQAGSSSASSSVKQAGASKEGTSSSLANLTDEELKTKYTEWAKETNYAEYDWRMTATEGQTLAPSLVYKHAYSAEAYGISSYPARNTTLMKEHASLSSSLPAGWNSSVFLLVDEGRPDILKALIIGPDETPYENGCFIFDILLGANYNQGPPSVKSMTTKNWKFRLNPNLYANGKVCLSLLGTWSGPGWVPGKSTLLQVLVSIQSMILWAEPITNEPGFEKDIKSARSKAYNANVRRMVTHIAILDQLKTPPEGFEEIIKTHFKLKSRSLRKQLDQWLAEDDGKPLHADSMSCIDRSSTMFSNPIDSAAAAATPDGATTPAAGPSKTSTQLAEDIAEIKELLDKLDMED